jgi:hypothetical protein
MSTETLPRTIEYHHLHPENFLLVENNVDRVTIHAAFDNFSEQRKAYLIREMAEEGFIPDHFQYFYGLDTGGIFGVSWVIDNSWLKVPHASWSQAERKLCVFLASVGVIFLFSLILLFAFK